MIRGFGVEKGLRRAWALACVVALALLAGPAFALGLGQIQVRSQAGQPLLAEIPIISSDPAELENLQARLASPETFARIGLDPPRGIVSDLQFSVALNARGEPVIRVTSPVPVQQSQLTFLVEVDWGQGRLVREYSALVDVPRTVAAPAQPAIVAPTPAPSNAIVREPAAPTPAPAPLAPAPAAQESTAGSTAIPPSRPQAATPTPAPPAAAPVVAAQPTAATPGEYGPVKGGDTLSKIAAGVGGAGVSLDQTMIALLRANPDAFINGNLNLIRRGAVLRVPDAAAQSQYGAAEARALVREQIGQWRSMSAPPPQPATLAGAATTADAARATAAGPRRASDARLEIVPPSASSGRRAGTQSGIDAGGEGDMLRQELQQTKETLAARDSEVQELKARVADLEKLQQDQQKLVAMKNSELAAAQQNLATRQAPAAPKAAADTTAAQAPPASPAAAQHAPPLWPWIVGALALVLLAAWLIAWRRSPAKPKRPLFDTAALAASVPMASRADDREATAQHSVAEPAVAEGVAAEHAVAERAPPPFAATPLPPAPVTGAPTWHDGTQSTLASLTAAGEPPPFAPVFTPAPSTAYMTPSLNPAPAGHERIELARAYIDLGDTDTARSLLQEVVDGGDAASRDEATRLLRDLA